MARAAGAGVRIQLQEAVTASFAATVPKQTQFKTINLWKVVRAVEEDEIGESVVNYKVVPDSPVTLAVDCHVALDGKLAPEASLRVAKEPRAVLDEFIGQSGPAYSRYGAEAVTKSLARVLAEDQATSQECRWASMHLQRLLCLRSGCSGNGNPANVIAA